MSDRRQVSDRRAKKQRGYGLQKYPDNCYAPPSWRGKECIDIVCNRLYRRKDDTPTNDWLKFKFDQLESRVSKLEPIKPKPGDAIPYEGPKRRRWFR